MTIKKTKIETKQTRKKKRNRRLREPIRRQKNAIGPNKLKKRKGKTLKKRCN
jgi:hypothetical protein